MKRPLLILLCLLLSLLAGALWALRRGEEISPRETAPLPAYPSLPRESSPLGDGPGGPRDGGLSEGPDEGPSPSLPDFSGLARGSGRPDPLLPPEGRAELSAEEEPLFSIDLPPLLREMASQLEELKEGIEDQTLESVTKGLNALPGLTASPDRARWSLRGDDVKLEVSIPAEDIRIDLDELIP